MLLQTISTTIGIFSIWLVPPEGDYINSGLQDLVQELSVEFASSNAKSFTPHVTVVQDIEVEPVYATAPLIGRLRDMAATIDPFNLTFSADPVHTTNQWYQNVVAYLDMSPDIVSVHNKLVSEFHGHNASVDWKEPSEHPHMPLVCATLTTAEKEQAKAKILSHSPWIFNQLSFPVEELQLWFTGPMMVDMDAWTLVGAAPLKGVAARETKQAAAAKNRRKLKLASRSRAAAAEGRKAKQQARPHRKHRG